MSDLCLIHEVPLVDEPGGDDMPTIHGRRYCPTCQALLMAALDADTCCVPDEGEEHCDHHPEWHDGRGCNHPECGDQP